MTSNQTVIIRMVRFETALQSPVPVPPTPTPIPTLPTSVPPTPTSEPAPAPTAAPGNTAVQPIQFQFLSKWGSQGSGDGQLNFPDGIAVDEAGNVYVADRDNHRVQKFGADGRFLLTWGSEGGGDGQFDRPRYVAVDGAWNVYVSDSGNHRVQVFAPVRPSPSTHVPISTPSPASTPTPGTFEELSSVEKSLVGLWFRSQAATETTNCRTRFVPTGSVYECRSESKNDGIWFYLRFNADRTGCSWEEPEARGRVRAKQSSFSDWEIEPPEHPELKLFRVEAVPRGFEYDQSIRRVWPKDLSGLIYGPSSTPKSCPE